MSVTGSPFCEHKKLRTSCVLCKAAALAQAPKPPVATTPYVHTEDRTPVREAAASKPPTKPGEKPAPKAATPGGPGKPLMPKRRTKNRVTAEDEARAQAWWVKK